MKEVSHLYMTLLEKQKKINYEMDLILNKMREMNRKPQQYHPKSQKFFPHPSSLRFSETSNKAFELQSSNEYLYNKIKNIKGLYSIENFEKSYAKSKYYESQILKNSIHTNQFLNVVTPFQLEKRLYKYALEHGQKTRPASSAYTRTQPSGYVSQGQKFRISSSKLSRRNSKKSETNMYSSLYNSNANSYSKINETDVFNYSNRSKKTISIEREPSRDEKQRQLTTSGNFYTGPTNPTKELSKENEV